MGGTRGEKVGARFALKLTFTLLVHETLSLVQAFGSDNLGVHVVRKYNLCLTLIEVFVSLVCYISHLKGNACSCCPYRTTELKVARCMV